MTNQPPLYYTINHKKIDLEQEEPEKKKKIFTSNSQLYLPAQPPRSLNNF